MGSIQPNTFGKLPDGHAYPVKSEFNNYDDQQQLQSSEDEFAGTPDQLSLSRSGQQLPETAGGVGGSSFATLSTNHAVSSSSAATKDPAPISKRTLQNRKAQREFRQRRATYLKDLEAKVRRYESDPTIIHPDVHHRINHLMQEIQYLRAIIDRLQQENAELRRADPTYSSHSSASTSSHPSYTLHPLYSSSSVQRSPQTYGSNALALAEMYQGPYPQNYHARTQAEPEVSPAGYPSEAPAPHGQQQHHHHHSATSDSRQSGLYQSNPSMDWPTMRQPGHLDDRPRTAPIDHHGGQTLQNDHDSSGPGPNYIYQGHTQGNFYPPEPRQAGSRPDGSAPHSSSHSTSPSGPSSAGGSAHIYAQYSNQALSASVPGNRPSQSGLGTSEHSQGWHNPTPPNMPYGPAGLHLPPGALPVAEERQDYNYQSVHFPQHLPHDSRSNTHSPSGAGRGDSRGGPS